MASAEKKKIAVVTGANRGLGFATCRALAQKGYLVVLTAREDKAREAARQLADEGLTVVPASLDVADDASTRSFLSWLLDRYSGADVLINNAGAIFEKGASSVGQVTPETISAALNTNTLGAYRLLQTLLPAMNVAGYGRVVNISSGMGALGEMGGGWPAYRISKAALNALTRIFHAEAAANVKVNSICPGWVRTEMGGSGASRSIEEGISGVIWAATLPDDGPSGGFFRDGQPIDW